MTPVLTTISLAPLIEHDVLPMPLDDRRQHVGPQRAPAPVWETSPRTFVGVDANIGFGFGQQQR
jgi:hypothetical protein